MTSDPPTVAGRVAYRAVSMTRTTMIQECADLYGVHPRLFTTMTQPVLETAWLIARAWWADDRERVGADMR